MCERPKIFWCGLWSARYHWMQRATYFRDARWEFGVAGFPKWPKNHLFCVQCLLLYISLIFWLIGMIFSLHVRSHLALQYSRKKISISTFGFGSMPKDHNLPSQIFSANWRPMITKPSVHVDPQPAARRKDTYVASVTLWYHLLIPNVWRFGT